MADWWESFAVVPDGPATVYSQVADFITTRIESGILAPGAKLPPERDLAVYLGVSYDTVRRAMAVLRERRLIETVQGRGTYVSAP